jgi:hypothetical protein
MHKNDQKIVESASEFIVEYWTKGEELNPSIIEVLIDIHHRRVWGRSNARMYPSLCCQSLQTALRIRPEGGPGEWDAAALIKHFANGGRG